MRWKNVSIIGLGLLGGSLGKAMVHRQLAERVTGLVRRSEAITDAVDAGVVHQAVMEPSKAVQEADLVVLCTPVLQIPSMVEQILPHLKAGCVVTDVGSVKCELVEKLEPLIASAGATYLGSHPMAGSEQQGLGHANAQLFVGATCVVTPSESTPAKVLAEVTALWELVGGHPRVMSAQEHDQCVAYASHLPHALAAMLSWSSLNPSQGKHPPALCSSGFRDTTRVASGSPEMWADIFISNRRAIMQSLSSHQDLCAQLAQWLEAGDRESILQWLSQSKSRRDDWLVTYLNRLEQAENPEDQLPLKNTDMLPEAIQLHPLETNQPITVGIPGSKSITNRALILAALTKGPTEIKGALWSEDTQVMTQCLQKLGFEIQIAQDPADNCNRTLTIQGQAGQIPGGGSTDSPMELYVGNAGTAARFLMAMLCLGSGVYRLSGVERMHERPQSELIASLRELGYVIETPNDRLPAIIHGRGPRPGASAQASIGQSSQFASALLLSAKVGQWEINLTEGSAEVAPYVQMTQQMVEAFAQRTSSTYQVEPDSSSGSYFWAMGYLLENHAPKVAGEIKIAQWPTTDWQIDTRFPHHLPLPQTLSRERDLGDSIMTAMVLAPWAAQPTCFTDLGRLRLQECERVNAMQRELIKCGVKVEQLGDTLVIEPGVVHGARIDTYNDHRMAMCFSVMGALVPDMVINKPECVKKTFPNFYQKLASAPPLGLGMTITQPGSSLALSEDLLFA